MQERDALSEEIGVCRALEEELKNLSELWELSESDPEMHGETAQALEDLGARATALRMEAMLSGEADRNNCYLEIHAGAGGTEAQDWALMLTRMYTRWADKKAIR